MAKAIRATAANTTKVAITVIKIGVEYRYEVIELPRIMPSPVKIKMYRTLV
jgi:hypothetical protein